MDFFSPPILALSLAVHSIAPEYHLKNFRICSVKQLSLLRILSCTFFFLNCWTLMNWKLFNPVLDNYFNWCFKKWNVCDCWNLIAFAFYACRAYLLKRSLPFQFWLLVSAANGRSLINCTFYSCGWRLIIQWPFTRNSYLLCFLHPHHFSSTSLKFLK